MKDQNKTTNKTKAAIVLLIVMVIILVSNFLRLKNSEKANEDMNAIFNDRLVVSEYIFKYANDIHFIKAIALQTNSNEAEKNTKIMALTQHIHKLNDLYLNTVLTAKEKTFFSSFLATCSAIEIQAQNDKWNQVNQSCIDALKTLKQLSQIQIKEGKAKLEHSNSIHRENTTWGQLQIALLVILGAIALFLLIVKKRKIKVKIPDSPSIN